MHQAPYGGHSPGTCTVQEGRGRALGTQEIIQAHQFTVVLLVTECAIFGAFLLPPFDLSTCEAQAQEVHRSPPLPCQLQITLQRTPVRLAQSILQHQTRVFLVRKTNLPLKCCPSLRRLQEKQPPQLPVVLRLVNIDARTCWGERALWSSGGLVDQRRREWQTNYSLGVRALVTRCHFA